MHETDANDTAAVLSSFAGTVTDCATEKRMGHYHPENKFIFTTGKVPNINNSL